MQPTVEKVGDVTIVAVNVEELDAGQVDDFRRALAPVLQNCRQLVLDLDRVQFVDSRGCGAILSCRSGSLCTYDHSVSANGLESC